jgi:hypothetical protein
MFGRIALVGVLVVGAAALSSTATAPATAAACDGQWQLVQSADHS